MRWLYFIIIYIRLLYRQWRRPKIDRFDVHTLEPNCTDPERNGLVASSREWQLGSPSLQRNENIQIVASNTFDGAGIHLSLKWRPHPADQDCKKAGSVQQQRDLYTIVSQLILETGRQGEAYEYNETLTRPVEKLPDEQWVREYRGDKIRLEIVEPYKLYRIVFTGHMRRIPSAIHDDDDSAAEDTNGEEIVFVRLRLLVYTAGKVMDMKESYDAKFVANQLAKQRPECGVDKAMSLILQDRHEHNIQIKGTYRIFAKNPVTEHELHEKKNESDEKKLFCWGFHTRHFLGGPTKGNQPSKPPSGQFDDVHKLLCKRVLIVASDGSLAHIGCIESTDSKFDPSQRFSFGYGCFVLVCTTPVQQIDGIDWDKISSTTRALDGISIKCEDRVKLIKSLDLNSNSRHFDVEFDGLPARAIIMINDFILTDYDDNLVAKSLAHYRQNRTCFQPRSLANHTDSGSSTLPLIVSLDDAECRSSSLCGSKAASLAQLRTFSKRNTGRKLSQFQVPTGVVVTRHAYDMLLEANQQLRDMIKNLSNLMCRDPEASIENYCERLVEMFGSYKEDLEDQSTDIDSCQLTIPQEIIDQLMAQIRQTFGAGSDKMEFAVRSSAWGEDEDGMSAAGQLSTFLCVPGKEKSLICAIIACFGSKFQKTSVEYKRQHALPIDAPMAVVVQQQIDCQRAGVMFTCSPTNGDQQQVLVTANYGLGESVVSGVSEPDTIFVETEACLSSPYDMWTSSTDESDNDQWIEGPAGSMGTRRRITRVANVVVGRKNLIMTSKSIHRERAPHDDKKQQKISLTDSETLGTAPSEENSHNHNNTGADEVANDESKVSVSTDSGLDDSHQDLTKCCLSESEALSLARVGLQLSAYFGDERDIEFGFAPTNDQQDQQQLYIFQARPVTSLDLPDSFEMIHELDSGLSGEQEFLSRANVGEVTPYAITPLTSTHSMKSWSWYGAQMFVKKLAQVDISRWCPQIAQEVMFMGHFFFFRLRASGMFAFGMSQGERPLVARALEIGMFGHEIDMPDLFSLARRSMMAPTKWFPWLWMWHSFPWRWFPNYMINRVTHKLRNLRRDVLKHKFVRSDSPPDLVRQLERVLGPINEAWFAHIFVTMLSPGYNQMLMYTLSKYCTDSNELFASFSRLIASDSGKNVLSAQVPSLIAKMAQALADANELDEFVRCTEGMSANGDTMGNEPLLTKRSHSDQEKLKEALKMLTRNQRSPVACLFNEFMEKYGHRCYNEFEVRAKVWRDDPASIVLMLRATCVSLTASQKQQEESTGNNNKNVDSILAQLPKKVSWLDRLLIKYYILPRCLAMMSARERTKGLLVYTCDCIRDSVRMLARQMRQAGLLPDDDLINFIKFDELRLLLSTSIQASDTTSDDKPFSPARWPLIVSHAQLRRRAYGKYRNWRYDEIVSGYDFQPSHLNDSSRAQEQERLSSCAQISGTPASAGTIEGPCRIVDSYDQLASVKKGDILVTHSTDIAFSPVFPVLAGIITEIGGLVSHGAVIAREYGLPSLIGIQDATKIFANGERVLLDADNGLVVRLEHHRDS